MTRTNAHALGRLERHGNGLDGSREDKAALQRGRPPGHRRSGTWCEFPCRNVRDSSNAISHDTAAMMHLPRWLLWSPEAAKPSLSSSSPICGPSSGYRGKRNCRSAKGGAVCSLGTLKSSISLGKTPEFQIRDETGDACQYFSSVLN